MRTSQLSLAIFAFLATASPIAKPELGEINAASALSTEPALSKRIIQGLISAGLVTINGKVATPGSQFSPGVYIEKLPEVPICDVSCLDARKTPRDSTCSKKGCTKDPKGLIFPTAVFVLKDGVTNYRGNQLVTCGVNTCLVKGGARIDTSRKA